jgi:hypothetical protein
MPDSKVEDSRLIAHAAPEIIRDNGEHQKVNAHACLTNHFEGKKEHWSIIIVQRSKSVQASMTLPSFLSALMGESCFSFAQM